MKTFERVDLLQSSKPWKRARPAARGGPCASAKYQLAVARRPLLLHSTGLLLKSSPVDPLHSTGDSEAGPERAIPLIKPSSRGLLVGSHDAVMT